MKLLAWLTNLIPEQYRVGIAIKKVSLTIAKTIVAVIAGTKIGKEISPDNWLVVSEVSAALIAGGMKFVHDWAKLKFPNVPFL